MPRAPDTERAAMDELGVAMRRLGRALSSLLDRDGCPSTAEVAQVAGCSNDRLQSIFTGDNRPESWAMVVAIVVELDGPVDYFHPLWSHLQRSRQVLAGFQDQRPTTMNGAVIQLEPAAKMPTQAIRRTGSLADWPENKIIIERPGLTITLIEAPGHE